MWDPRRITTIRASTTCYRNSFTFLYVDLRTLQETHLWASTAGYGDSFTVYIQVIFVPHRKDTYGPPRPVTEIALLLYM
jgi:hypothetical protein